MKKRPASRSAFFNPRFLISCAFCAIGVLLALLAFAVYPGGAALAKGRPQDQPTVPELAQDSATARDDSLTQAPLSAPSAPVVSTAPRVQGAQIDGTEQGGPCSFCHTTLGHGLWVKPAV